MLTNQIFFDIILSVVEIIYGEMSERLKEPVLKTGDVRASVGSNPTLSSIFFYNQIIPARNKQSRGGIPDELCRNEIWRSTQEAEEAPLLRV